MFCSRCGAEQPESNRFCERCGHRHESDDQASALRTGPTLRDARARPWLIGAAAVLVIVAAVAAVLAVTVGFDSGDADMSRADSERASAPPTVTDTATETGETTQRTTTETAAGGEPPARATVARTCGRGGVGGDCVLSVRADPSAAATEIDVLGEGDVLRLSCQVQGEPVYSSALGITSDVWARTAQGGYVANVYVDGPGLRPGEITLPRC